MDYLDKQPTLKKVDMRFGAWNVRSLYRAVAKQISKYKLDLVGVQEVIWDSSGTEPAGKYTFFYGKVIDNHELDTNFFGHKRIISAAKMVEFVCNRMSYIIISCLWCDIIVLNVHAPTEDKTDDEKDRFYKEPERVFDKFPE
jgi:hypothetical protein